MNEGLSPEERWEQGIDHDERSIKIARGIAAIDMANGDHMDLSFGGDGDNGEYLLYLLDIYFEEGDRSEEENP